MAERAHPDDQGFQDYGWRFCLRRGWIPWLLPPKPNPHRVAFEWRYEWVSQHCHGKKVVDVPCGMGWGTSRIQHTAEITGIDIDADSIDEAKKRYADHAEFLVGSMAELPFDDQSIDVVSCLEGIEHVPVELGDQFLEEAARVLKPDGLLLLSSPYCTAGGHSGNPHHVYEYQPSEIREKVGKHFEIGNSVSKQVSKMTVVYMECAPK